MKPTNGKKPSARDAATHFLEERFPDCEAAILGGSAANGTIHNQSDLDLVVIDPEAEYCYREVFEHHGWMIETFVFYEDAYLDFFAESESKGIPTLQRLCTEGTVLVSKDGVAEKLIQAAGKSLQRGPKPWTLDDMNASRYELTELIHDLEDGGERLEKWAVVQRMVWMGAVFALKVQDRWVGEGKWLMRELRRLDNSLYTRLEQALDEYASSGNTGLLVRWVDQVLEPFGGRLSCGFFQAGSPGYPG